MLDLVFGIQYHFSTVLFTMIKSSCSRQDIVDPGLFLSSKVAP
jgi:hypothetical protein